MEHLIYKDSRGASQADAHYLEYGHKIVVTNEWNTRGDKIEKLIPKEDEDTKQPPDEVI